MASNTNKQILETIRQKSGNEVIAKCILELYNWESSEKGYQFKDKYKQTLMAFSRKLQKEEKE